MHTKFRIYLAGLCALVLPGIASAHEVYVLSPEQISYALGIAPFNMLEVVRENLHQFIFWAFIGFVVVSTVFCISIFRFLEGFLDPLFNRGKRYAAAICRITVALGILAGAYNQATFGPELPLSAAFGIFTPLVTALLLAIGICFLAGLWVRVAAFAALALFAFGIYHNGVYMLTYANYFGEFLVLFLCGVHGKSSAIFLKDTWRSIGRACSRYYFPVIRVSFGISLLYSSLYAKILHNNLALMVAQLPLAGHQYGVAHYFGFEPHFMVLGAAIIEIIIALFFILGIEIRWTCIFLEFWLSLSLWWFGESVWPHLVLIGIPIALFLHGYDRYSLEGYFFKKRLWEPIL